MSSDRSTSSGGSGAASDAVAPLATGGSSAATGAVSGSSGGSGAAVTTPTTTLTQRAAAPHVVATRPCEEQVRAREPGLGTVVYYATARQGSVPAYVRGFSSGSSSLTLLLLAQDGCRELLRSAGP